jgi:hypothetical protein
MRKYHAGNTGCNGVPQHLVKYVDILQVTPALNDAVANLAKRAFHHHHHHLNDNVVFLI